MNFQQSPERIIHDLIIETNQQYWDTALMNDSVLQYTIGKPIAGQFTKTTVKLTAIEDSKTILGETEIEYDRLYLQNSKILDLPQSVHNYHISNKTAFSELKDLINSRLGLELTMNDWDWPDELQNGENALSAHAESLVIFGSYLCNITFASA